jgi:hypothetical protein
MTGRSQKRSYYQSPGGVGKPGSLPFVGVESGLGLGGLTTIPGVLTLPLGCDCFGVSPPSSSSSLFAIPCSLSSSASIESLNAPRLLVVESLTPAWFSNDASDALMASCRRLLLLLRSSSAPSFLRRDMRILSLGTGTTPSSPSSSSSSSAPSLFKPMRSRSAWSATSSSSLTDKPADIGPFSSLPPWLEDIPPSESGERSPLPSSLEGDFTSSPSSGIFCPEATRTACLSFSLARRRLSR